MNIISQVIDTIKEYGRVKLYDKKARGNQYEVIDLFVTNEGLPMAIRKTETYDIPYLSDGIFSESAELQEVINVASYHGDDINLVLCDVLHNGFYSNKYFNYGFEEYCINTPDESLNVNTEEAVGIIYTSIMKMLSLSNHDLTQFILGDTSASINIMLDKAKSDIVIEPVPFEEAMEIIDYRIDALRNRWFELKKIYKKGSYAKTQEELDQAIAEWQQMCKDTDIIELTRK